MQYTQFGRSGLVVSRMTFGAMTFGHLDYNGFQSNVGPKLAREMVARALAAGVNVFDTADMYSAGQSETILGQALGRRRRDVVLSTKVYFRTGEAVLHAGLSRRHIIDACESSLRRLGTDFIDLYLLHNFDPLTPLEETARALEDLQRQGKIRYAGHSNLAAWQSQKLLGIQERLGFAPLVGMQVYYSLLGRDIERALIPHARDAGLGIMVWGPLAGGFLTGKYTRQQPDGDGGRRATFDFPPIDRERGHDVVDALTDIAAAHGVSPAQVALAWTLANPAISTVLIGASKVSQLESNLAAASLSLEAGELEALSSLTRGPPSYPEFMHWGADPVTRRALDEGFKPSHGEPPP
ncbi:MAG: aldo/keto reductase [Myxococcales bacterium]|nr:aldo/keto reductase [Myxococcales bacterium]